MPSFIVHGGAGRISSETAQDCREGIHGALEAGWKILSRGGSAIDAVETAIAILEDNPNFDAGFGSHLNLDGQVQLDAIVMDGATLKAGAVAAVERVRNPIRLARQVLEKSQHMMLVAAGAEKFATENGIKLCLPEELISNRARDAWRRCFESPLLPANDTAPGYGTVGAVALDAQGQLVAGTSTGGTYCKYPGRVGDSPLIGCGCYADSESGGASCTGHGEGIMKIVMAKMAVDLLRDPGIFPLRGSDPGASVAESVATACVRTLASRAHSTGGLILLDRAGRPGLAFNTANMSYGYVKPDGSFCISS